MAVLPLFHIIFLIFVNIIVINAAILQPNYFFEAPIIKARLIDPGCTTDNEILRIPDGKTSYRISSEVLLKSMELQDRNLNHLL